MFALDTCLFWNGLLCSKFDYVGYNTVNYFDSPPLNCQPQIENTSGAVVASWYLKGSAQDSRK